MHPALPKAGRGGCCSNRVVWSALMNLVALRTCEAGCMREGVEVRLRPGDRERLVRIVSDRKSPQHHVWTCKNYLKFRWL